MLTNHWKSPATIQSLGRQKKQKWNYFIVNMELGVWKKFRKIVSIKKDMADYAKVKQSFMEMNEMANAKELETIVFCLKINLEYFPFYIIAPKKIKQDAIYYFKNFLKNNPIKLESKLKEYYTCCKDSSIGWFEIVNNVILFSDKSVFKQACELFKIKQNDKNIDDFWIICENKINNFKSKLEFLAFYQTNEDCYFLMKWIDNLSDLPPLLYKEGECFAVDFLGDRYDVIE